MGDGVVGGGGADRGVPGAASDVVVFTAVADEGDDCCFGGDLCGAFGVDCGWVQRADFEVVGGGGVLGRVAS
jgi:hypothetical protein